VQQREARRHAGILLHRYGHSHLLSPVSAIVIAPAQSPVTKGAARIWLSEMIGRTASRTLIQIKGDEGAGFGRRAICGIIARNP